MKKFRFILPLMLLAIALWISGVPLIYDSVPDEIQLAEKYQFTPLRTIQKAFDDETSDLQILQQGKVYKILEDDLDGTRHQKFIVGLINGQTLLLAHNIDLAPRIDNLQAGDRVIFFGEYEWNKHGGVVHWTHKDPAARHVGGWIDHQGIRYQ